VRHLRRARADKVREDESEATRLEVAVELTGVLDFHGAVDAPPQRAWRTSDQSPASRPRAANRDAGRVPSRSGAQASRRARNSRRCACGQSSGFLGGDRPDDRAQLALTPFDLLFARLPAGKRSVGDEGVHFRSHESIVSARTSRTDRADTTCLSCRRCGPDPGSPDAPPGARPQHARSPLMYNAIRGYTGAHGTDEE
jgi:hypothetical protein